MNKMRFQLLSVLMILSIPFQALAQTNPHSSKVYYAVVDTGSSHFKAVLSGVTDSSLILASTENYSTFTLSYKKIEQIKIKARGRIGRGMAIGAGAGLIIGLIIGDVAAPTRVTDTSLLGLLEGIDVAAYVIEGGFLGLIGGGVAGALVGSSPNETIEVYRDQKQFLAAVPKIKMYCSNQ